MSQLVGILTAVIVLALVIALLRKGKLRERHAIWWLAAGFVSLLLAIFPGLLQGLSDALGIEIPVNLLFFVSITALFFAYLQASTELVKLEDKVRTLAEHVALLEIKNSPDDKK